MDNARSFRPRNSNMLSISSNGQQQSNSGRTNRSNLIIHSRNSKSWALESTLTIGKGDGSSIDTTPKTFIQPLSATRDDILDDSVASVDPEVPVDLTVWFHELRNSSEDVLIDIASLPGASIGDVYEVEQEGKPHRLAFKISEQSIKQSTESQKSKIQLSLLSVPLQKVMDITPRSVVTLRKVMDFETVEADTVEIFLKDINFARDSMWIFSSSLVDTCVYCDKRVSYFGNRLGVVKHIYKKGKRCFSGYVSEKTKIVFRSESCKLLFLIQLSKEMWHFEENGDIVFHNLVNNLLPKIFKKWRESNSHHSITIVLFTSIDLTNVPWTSMGQGELPNNCRDYFRVVVDSVSIQHWDKIMTNLRLEFANFKRDVLLKEDRGRYLIEGAPLPSVKGNILEALNFGLTLTSDRFRNTDLKHTLSHYIVMTPGTGLFDVDHQLMLDTSKKIGTVDSAFDIICLNQPPMHIVPLFRSINKNGELTHHVPNWCDISFFKDHDINSNSWMPRCKIYELQMMGVMENDLNDVEIERFSTTNNAKSVLETMDLYDENLFKPVKKSTKKLSRSKSDKDTSIRFKLPTPTDSSATLSLIWNEKTVLTPTSSSSKFDVSTTNSTVLGTVTNTDVTALSSLYHLNKTTDDRSLSSAISVRSFKSLHKSNESNFSSKIPRKIKSVPKIPKQENNSNISKSQEKSTSEYLKNTHMLPNDEIEEEYRNILLREIYNPSRNMKAQINDFLENSRWSDVLPSDRKRRLMKWKSLKAPGNLPIMTSLFPTMKQLQTEYKFQIYTVFLNSDNIMKLKSSGDLMREMIQLRLVLGFQICYGDEVVKVESERSTGNAESLIKYITDNDFYGRRIYMSFGDEIHRLFCDYNGNMNVQLYHKIEEDIITNPLLGKKKHYNPLVRTRYMDEYSPIKIDILSLKPPGYNWNQFDQFLAGYDDSIPEENKEFHFMKFVVMPTDIPKNAFFISNEHLNDEEVRVEGLRKLIATIEKGKFASSNQKKDDVLPDITFYTGNLYDFLHEQAESYDLTGNHPVLMLPESMRFNKSIKLYQLASELQDSTTGLKLVDRTWHFKVHPHCFLGNELVSWLVECFEDIDDREDAIKYGQSLMDKGLLKHVENRHGLLDGHYFYEFENSYIDRTRKSERHRWFAKIKTNDSASKASSDSESVQSPSLTVPETESENSSLNKTKKKFNLSKAVTYNADPLKKSCRSELVTVHYDRVHNPEHCYHIRLQWLNTTSKFIDDVINNWSRLCERHGLKLVETPWKELCTIPTYNPLHSFLELKLSLNPWSDPEFSNFKYLKNNVFYYHLYLLKKTDFLLDNRSTVFFSKENIEITYSWGAPSFKFAQFIHKSGLYIVELKDDGSFFLGPNNPHIMRLNASATSNYNSQKIMLDFRSICKSEDKLRPIFSEAKANWKETYIDEVLPSEN